MRTSSALCDHLPHEIAKKTHHHALMSGHLNPFIYNKCSDSLSVDFKLVSLASPDASWCQKVTLEQGSQFFEVETESIKWCVWLQIVGVWHSPKSSTKLAPYLERLWLHLELQRFDQAMHLGLIHFVWFWKLKRTALATQRSKVNFCRNAFFITCCAFLIWPLQGLLQVMNNRLSKDKTDFTLDILLVSIPGNQCGATSQHLNSISASILI